jgi:hypothetical protein
MSAPLDLEGLWLADDGKAVHVVRSAPDAWSVTVSPTLSAPPYGRDALPADSACRVPSQGTRDLPAAWTVSGRLPHLAVEAEGAGSTGRLYQLHPVVEDLPGEQHRWRPAAPDDPRESWRLLPATAPGLQDALSYHEDEGQVPWAEPLTLLRPATRVEVARYWATRPAQR